MSRDEHIQKILTFVFDELGLVHDPTHPFAQAFAHALFILVDKAVADGVSQARYDLADAASRN